MKSFKSTAWLLPQPVLIIGTYDKGGACDVDNITGEYHDRTMRCSRSGRKLTNE